MRKCESSFFKMQKLKQFEDDGCVFKKCCYKKDYCCLVVLRRPKSDFKSNESRSGIIDKNFAKFRCNGLITVAIYDLFGKKFINSLVHTPNFRAPPILYVVDQLSKPDEFEEEIEIVCSSGIHYFLSLEAALNYNYALAYIMFVKDERMITMSPNGESSIVLSV